MTHAPPWLQHEGIRAGIIFSFGMVGIHVLSPISPHEPALLRRTVPRATMVGADDTNPMGGAS